MALAEETNQATLLVVDDEHELRRLLVRLLEGEGFNVLSASHAMEALRILRQHAGGGNEELPPIDLVLLDLALPDMNGITLFSKLQADERLRKIPVMFLTGDVKYQQKALAFEAGAVDYITKPFHKRDLILRIRAHIRDRWLREKEQSSAVQIASHAKLTAQEAEQRFLAVVRNSFHLVCELNHKLHIIYASPNHREILNYNPDKLLNIYWPSLVNKSERNDVVEALLDTFTANFEKRILVQFADGSKKWRWLDVCVSVFETSKGARHLLLVSRDTTQAKETERYLQHLVQHDHLTGLANRQRFTTELETIYARHPEGAPYAVIYIDVDNFKLINDQHGHFVGDQVLRAAGEFLKRHIGSRSVLLARFGGDEFCAIIPASTEDEAEGLGKEIRDLVARHPIHAAGVRHRITLSLGISMMEHGLSIKEILSRANTALHVAKSDGKNRVCLYRSESTELHHLHRSAEWFQRIQDGIDENRFEYFYQPIVCLKTGKSKHHEVLIRYRDTEGHLHSPAAFLPAAERYGLMPQLDRHIVCAVLEHMREYPTLKVAVNLSGASITDPELPGFLSKSMKASHVSPKRLTFEITETVFMTNLAQAKQLVEQLQSLGCSFALDDFGTGFSSLNYLRHLPVNVLKIDGSFIQEIENDEVSLTLLKSILEIARLLGKTTVAEWVETEGTRKLLAEIGCDYAQGFHTGRPQPLEKLFPPKPATDPCPPAPPAPSPPPALPATS